MADIQKKQITALDLANPIGDNNLFLCRQGTTSKRATAQQVLDYVLPQIKIVNDTAPQLGGNLDTNGFYLNDSTRSFVEVNTSNLHLTNGSQLTVDDGVNSSTVLPSKIGTSQVNTVDIIARSLESSGTDDLTLRSATDKTTIQAGNSSQVAVFQPSQFDFFTPVLAFEVSNPEILNGSNKVLELHQTGGSTLLRNNGSTSAFLSLHEGASNSNVLRHGTKNKIEIGGQAKVTVTDNDTSIDNTLVVEQDQVLRGPIKNGNFDAVIEPASSTNAAPKFANTYIWFYTLSANQNLSNGWNTIVFDGSDNTQELNAPEPNASGQFVAPVTGYYQVSGSINFQSLSSSDGAAVYEWAININGTRREIGRSETREISGNQVMGHFSTGISQIVHLTSGQTLTMEGYQRSAQDIEVHAGSTFFSGHLITAG